MLHIFSLAFFLRIALPGFLVGGLISLFMPAVTGGLQTLIGAWLKREMNWQSTVSPLIGEALNIVFGVLFATVLVKAGVGVSDSALSCLKDPATKLAASCIDSQTIGNLITYLTTILTAVIGGKAVNAHVAWKRASAVSRSAGAGRGA